MAAVVGRGCASHQTSQHMLRPVITNSAILILHSFCSIASLRGHYSRTSIQLQVINNSYYVCFRRGKKQWDTSSWTALSIAADWNRFVPHKQKGLPCLLTACRRHCYGHLADLCVLGRGREKSFWLEVIVSRGTGSVKEKTDWINAAGKKLLLLLEMRKSKNIVQHW